MYIFVLLFFSFYRAALGSSSGDQCLGYVIAAVAVAAAAVGSGGGVIPLLGVAAAGRKRLATYTRDSALQL